MAIRITTETFFRPVELSRERLAIPAALFNRCRVLRKRSPTRHLFVPIRNMQYLTVVDSDEIIFVDSNGGYAVQDGQGGRIIKLAWQLREGLQLTRWSNQCQLSWSATRVIAMSCTRG
jgi:hypothetical protein